MYMLALREFFVDSELLLEHFLKSPKSLLVSFWHSTKDYVDGLGYYLGEKATGIYMARYPSRST